MTIVYGLTRGGGAPDIVKDVARAGGEPMVQLGADRFFGTDLEQILTERAIKMMVLVGTSAHMAALHTATGAAMRGSGVIVPVDGMSADEPYAEPYTAWHRVNAPGSRGQVTLTRSDLIACGQE